MDSQRSSGSTKRRRNQSEGEQCGKMSGMAVNVYCVDIDLLIAVNDGKPAAIVHRSFI